MARPARRSRGQAQVAGLLLGALAGCASVGAPPGGPPDTAPPRIISIKPESGAVVPNFKDELVIQFDETIDEQPGTRSGGGAETGLAQQVLLSPVAGRVNVRWHRSRVTVKPREGWKNRVYRLEVLPGFYDLRRNRFDSSATVLFTTGPEIGHARLGGIALKWVEQSILQRAVIEAVPLPDSVGYLTLADSGGQFNLENLRPGPYIVYAWADDNNDRRRGLREPYDSLEVTIDSTENVALFTFVHDTNPPRPRAATFVDSVTVRVEFSQPLDPSAPIDTTTLRVLELPDSTPIRLAQIYTQRQFDSLQAAERQKADTATPAADTSARQPPSLRSGQAVRPSARPTAPPTRPSPPPVDTALVRLLLARRPVPSDKIVVRVANPLKPDTRYVVQIQAATNLTGRKGEGNVSFTVPKPAARDTTAQPPPPNPPRCQIHPARCRRSTRCSRAQA
jgi:hypothetical protein